MHCIPNVDVFFTVKLNFNRKRRGIRVGPDLNAQDIQNKIPVSLTKRLILSCVNGLYDPLGLIAPFIIRGKNAITQIMASRFCVSGLGSSYPYGNTR